MPTIPLALLALFVFLIALVAIVSIICGARSEVEPDDTAPLHNPPGSLANSGEGVAHGGRL